MADITMCSGEGCPVKQKCKRFTAIANEHWQSWFAAPPIEDGKCEMYWGDNAESVFNQLKDITSGNENVQ
jgi:hypothetical protein